MNYSINQSVTEVIVEQPRLPLVCYHSNISLGKITQGEITQYEVTLGLINWVTKRL